MLVPEAAEYVAIGAARQAAWALAQTSEPPRWPDPKSASYQGEPVPQIRERYAALREATVGRPWLHPSAGEDAPQVATGVPVMRPHSAHDPS